MSDHNLTVTLGTTWGFDVVLADSAGAPVDPTAATWRMADESGVLVECTLGDGIRIETVAGERRARIDVTPAKQALVRAGVYPHALQIVEASGAVAQPSSGFVTVEDSPPFAGEP